MNNMTALVSCFARYYHTKTDEAKIFDDPLAGEIFFHDGVVILKNHASDLRFQLGSERLFDQLVRNSCHFPLAKRGNLLYNEIGTQ